MNAAQEVEKILEEVSELLRKGIESSRRSGLLGCERTLLHMLSHAQTILEGLSESDPGFTL